MHKERDITIGVHHWRIILHDGELAFYYLTITQPTFSALDIGFMHSDERDDVLFEPEIQLEWLEAKNLQDMNPFLIKRQLTRNIVSLVKDHDNFYFQASCIDMKSIYDQICFHLWEKLGNNWDFQIAEGHYYFKKVN